MTERQVSITDLRNFLEKEGRERPGNHAGSGWAILRRELGGEPGSKTNDLKFDPEDIRKLLNRNKFGPGRSKGDERTRPNYVRNLGQLLHGDFDDFLKERGF